MSVETVNEACFTEFFKEETIFQFGNQNPPWRKSFSSLEIKIPYGGNAPPIWRAKIIVMETFLQSGGRKKSRWKPSSNLEGENYCDGNAPPIWRKKIIVILRVNFSGSKAKKPYHRQKSSLFY